MLTESIVLYGAAVATSLLAAFTIAPMLVPRRSRPPLAESARAVAALMLALCALLGWRAVPPFWNAMRIGLYDAQDALLSAAAAFALLMLAGALRRAFKAGGRP